MVRSTWLAAACLLTVYQTAPAQRPQDRALVDSAAVARAAWPRAVAAFRARDLVVAEREASRAAAAWPTQPAYLWGLALIAAAARDTAVTLRALRDYAALGLGRDLRRDSSFVPFRELPAFAALSAVHDSNRAPLTRSTIAVTLPDSTFWPEGMDYDPTSGRFYVASVRHGGIAVLKPGGAVRMLLSPRPPGVSAVLGVRVAPGGGVLWATTSGLPQAEGYQAGDSAVAALLRVRISDGVIERRWEVPPTPGGHVLGDLAVGPGGEVYVTDSNQPELLVLRPGADSLTRVTSPLFRSLQGVAPTPDGGALYLADYSHGLLRVDLASGELIRLPDAPGSTSLGCDGIVWDRGAIIAVQNGVTPARIMRFVLDRSGTRILRAELLDRNATIADEPTIGAIVGSHFVYVANSQWEKYREDGSRRPVPLTAPLLLAVPLPR